MRYLTSSLLFFTVLATLGQKLPNKQEKSVWAPANIKIDGKTDEWDNKFQAYNSATELFYTISNDDKRLYLTIQATKSSIIEKMMEGGIEFIIKSNQKDNGKTVNILFPLLSMPRCQGILLAAGKQLNAKNTIFHIAEEDTAYTSKVARSIDKANGMLGDNLKEIKILGIESVTDTIPNVTNKTPYYSSLPLRDHHYRIISIANADDIRANTLFDNAGNYNYEIAIPLMDIKAVLGNSKAFKYTVIVHGRGEDRRIGDVRQFGPPGPDGKKQVLYLDFETPTDFSGEYTLAKAP